MSSSLCCIFVIPHYVHKGCFDFIVRSDLLLLLLPVTFPSMSQLWSSVDLRFIQPNNPSPSRVCHSSGLLWTWDLYSLTINSVVQKRNHPMPGSSWRPSACEADVIATRPIVLLYLFAAGMALVLWYISLLLCLFAAGMAFVLRYITKSNYHWLK
jgi:hypothetical protein